MFKGTCYRFSLEEKDWNEAEKSCNLADAHLASIFSDKEVAFIRCLQDASSIHKTWIGGSRWGNTFKWIDGKAFDYENWNTGEPDNLGGEENCIEVYSDPGQSWHDKWNDIPCNQKRNYVCKKQPVGGKTEKQNFIC